MPELAQKEPNALEEAGLGEVVFVVWFPHFAFLRGCTEKGEKLTLVLTNLQHPWEEMDFTLQKDVVNCSLTLPANLPLP